MEMAIYGLAMPFNQFYWNYNSQTNTYELELTNYEVTELWKEIPLTLEHNKYWTIGRTGKNLSVLLNPAGVFFKLVPDTPESFKAYKDVKEGFLRHCSVTFLRHKSREFVEECKIQSLARIMNLNHNFIVEEHNEVLVHEICLTNSPGNKATFCTTDRNDMRLKGVKWDVYESEGAEGDATSHDGRNDGKSS
ncbi:HK97 family phage prohead protease [Jeotgalibacillus soli]|uniref:Prohead serine protease domain-containing protein n=1 Tax=Jeotgalibacillus soli TaxID=889306 RepID=A0A0C2V7T6_9BACL|nr:HK97 family phage prohead protease [Jeotgalibacillus soli]KIL45007.1 hypothetical protein KP78_25510 [Jeotgalibacillus soli]